MAHTQAVRALSIAGLCLNIIGFPALAAPSISGEDADASSETIVVTARKVKEALIDVPGSVSVITAGDLDRTGMRSFSDLTHSIPNVAQSGGIGGSLQGQIAIRGIATLVRNIGVESGVGIYIDGVYIGRPEAYNQELLDVSQVEVLRGPQGTVFGKNTIAGVFNIATAAPTDHFEGDARLDAGNYGLVRVQGTLSGPLVGDTVTARASLGYVTRDGFGKNLSGGKDPDSANLFSWRAAVAIKASDDVTVTLRTDGLRDRGQPGFFSSTDLIIPYVKPSNNPRDIDDNRPNFLSRDVAGGSMTVTADLGKAELTSISAFRSSRYNAALDDDQQQIDFSGADDFRDQTDMWTQEVRISGHANRSLSYVAGLYLLSEAVKTDRALAIGSDLAAIYGVPANVRLTTKGRVVTQSVAAFGSVDWRFAPRFTLSVGARYTYEHKKADFIQDDEQGIFAFFGLPSVNYSGHSTDNDVSPTASLTYAATDNLRLYARVARGFKSAAYNVDLVASGSGVAAGPERATTYEGGLKGTLVGGKVDVALTGFHTDYENLQVSQITGGATVLSNAGKASIDGFEAELTARPVHGLRIEGSAGYSDAHYVRFDHCAIPASEAPTAAAASTNCNGKRLIGAPPVTARGAVQYDWGTGFGVLTPRVETDYQSATYFDATNSPRFRAQPRTLLNARLTLHKGNWTSSAWIENLTNKLYETYLDDRTALGVRRTIAYGPPRTFGFTVATHF